MRNIILITLILYSTSVISQTSCEITYVANEGFLIKTANKKILVDALFGGFDGDWCDKPNDDTKSKLDNATSPFDNVDIIAITHKHRDHFNADMVINHLVSNPKCMVVCAKQVDSLLMNCSNYGRVKHNVIAITPAIMNDTALKLNDTQIKILRLEHSPYYIQDYKTGLKVNKHKNIENIGFLFKVDGFNIFHCGDTNPWNEEEYRIFKLQTEQIDIAFLDRIFMSDSQTKGIINNYIKPQNIILMHVEPNNSKKYNDMVVQIKDSLPSVFIFDKSMGYKTYRKK